MDNYKKLHEDAVRYDGGNAILIKLLNQYNIPFEISSKKPTVRIAIRTNKGTIAFYDRKRPHKVRADIPLRHPLAYQYETLGGYLFNNHNHLTSNSSYIYVFFDEKNLDNLVRFIKDNTFFV